MTKRTIIYIGILTLVCAFGTTNVSAEGLVMSNVSLSTVTMSQAQVSKIAAELRQGMTGNDVKTLQTLLATWPNIYPEGLVTGFFGPLTQKAVTRFQENNELRPTGEVNADTLKRINVLLTGGNMLSFSEVSAVNLNNDTTRISWTTDVPATTKLYYSTTTPLTSGASAYAVYDSRLSTSHAVDVGHLLPSTTYHYLLVSSNGVGTATSSTEISHTSGVK